MFTLNTCLVSRSGSIVSLPCNCCCCCISLQKSSKFIRPSSAVQTPASALFYYLWQMAGSYNGSLIRLLQIEPLRWMGRGMGRGSFPSPNHQHQSTEKNTQHQHQPVARTNSFFIHNWTHEGMGRAPFTLAIRCRFQACLENGHHKGSRAFCVLL